MAFLDSSFRTLRKNLQFVVETKTQSPIERSGERRKLLAFAGNVHDGPDGGGAPVDSKRGCHGARARRFNIEQMDVCNQTNSQGLADGFFSRPGSQEKPSPVELGRKSVAGSKFRCGEHVAYSDGQVALGITLDIRADWAAVANGNEPSIAGVRDAKHQVRLRPSNEGRTMSHVATAGAGSTAKRHGRGRNAQICANDPAQADANGGPHRRVLPCWPVLPAPR